MESHADTRLRERYGISIGDFTYLATLASTEPTDVTGLAQCLVVSKAAVSKRVPLLERAGWLSKNPDPGHAKRIVLSLTEQGQQLVAAAGSEIEADFRTLLIDPRLDPGIEPERLQRHLAILSELASVRSKP